MIYISSNNVRHPVTKTFTTLHQLRLTLSETASPFKMGPMVRPETSSNNHHNVLRNNPEKRKPQFLAS